MKHRIKPVWLLGPLVLGILAGLFTTNIAIGVAIFAILLTPIMVGVYIPYAKDNPTGVWFKRKLYGWGWTPVTWQGWLATVVYVGLIALFAFTIDERSPASEVAFTFALPAVLLTIAFIRLASLKGEKPRWQWGEEDETK